MSTTIDVRIDLGTTKFSHCEILPWEVEVLKDPATRLDESSSKSLGMYAAICETMLYSVDVNKPNNASEIIFADRLWGARLIEL
ncbi:MAG: hypothetical protein H0X08_04520 [Blastocatellia bacterium]|nr:hypothetical protein [Blastocatellia bacterium]